MIIFPCPYCGQPLEADDSYVGMTIACPACQAHTTVPSESDAADTQILVNEDTNTNTNTNTDSGATLNEDSAPTSMSTPPALPPSLPPSYEQRRSLYSPTAPPPPPMPRYTWQPPPAPPAPQPRTGVAIWLLPLLTTIIAVVLGLVGGSLINPPGTGGSISSYEMGRYVGYGLSVPLIALVLALVFAGILALCRLSFVKWLSRIYSGLALLIAGFFTLGALAKYAVDAAAAKKEERKVATRAALEGMQSDLERMVKESKDSDGMPKQNPLRFDTSKPAANEMERTRQLVQALLNDISQVQNDYLRALEEAGVSRLLLADRMAGDIGFNETRSILDNMRKVVREFKGRADRALNSFPEKITAMGITGTERANMIRGYERGLAKSIPKFTETWEIEVASVELMAELVDHLEATRADWSAQDGQFTFLRDADLERFQEIMDRINAGVARQEAIQKQSQQEASANLKRLGDDIPGR